jgi:hypothetical protein
MAEFDRTPDRAMLGAIGKEGLEQFARELAALHRPASFDWAARFGLSEEVAIEHPQQAGRPATAMAARKPWVVKRDGPCSRCGRLLVAGTEAVWRWPQRKLFCLECARVIEG